MLERYRVRISLVLFSLVLEAFFVVYTLLMQSVNNVDGVLEGYAVSFALTLILYFLIRDAFLKDRCLYFDPKVKSGSMFVFLTGILALVIFIGVYILTGQVAGKTQLSLMLMSLVAWFLALVFMVVITLFPRYRVSKK